MQNSDVSINYCNSWIGGLFCYVTGGIAQGIQPFLPTTESASQLAQSIIAELGKLIGEGSDQIGSTLGSKLNQQTNQFFSTANFTEIFTKGASELGGAGNQGAQTFLETFNLPELIAKLAEQFSKTSQESGPIFEQVARDAISSASRLFSEWNQKYLPWVASGLIIRYGIPYVLQYASKWAEKNFERPKMASEVKYYDPISIAHDTVVSTISNAYKVTVPSILSAIYAKNFFVGLTVLKDVPYIKNFIPEAVKGFAQKIRDDISTSSDLTLVFLPNVNSLTPEGLFVYQPDYHAKWVDETKLESYRPLVIGNRRVFLPYLQSIDRIAFAVGVLYAFGVAYKLYQDHIKALKEEPEAIFDEEISSVIEDITHATHNIQKHNGYFQNVLLYGPGGTGKTMVAKIIAKNAKINYVMMSGGALAQHIKNKDHVTELNNLISRAKNSSRPTILFIDEAESLAKKRDSIGSIEHLELQNAFLNHTGEPDKKLMIILATNRLEDIDEAILSRMDHKLHIAPPKAPERKKILQQYILKFFKDVEERDSVFTEAKVEELAEKTDGFTGRLIFKLLNAIAGKKSASKENRLTSDMVDSTLKRFIQQEKEVLELREKNKPVIEPVLEKKESFYERFSRVAERFFKIFNKRGLYEGNYYLR